MASLGIYRFRLVNFGVTFCQVYFYEIAAVCRYIRGQLLVNLFDLKSHAVIDHSHAK